MTFPINVFSATIENIAEVNYKNEQNKSFSNSSNPASTNTTDVQGFKVELTPSFNSVDGQSKGTWLFPVKVNNTGNGNDIYDLSLDSLPDGVIGEIYSDVNGNGVLDPEDKLTNFTSLVEAGKTFPIIVSLTDNKGFPVGSKINFNVNAISKTVQSVNDKKPLEVNIIPAPDYSVNLIPKVSVIEGQSKGIWEFPVKVGNTGKKDDSYKLTLAGLPNGIIPEIYLDLNVLYYNW